jgi:hypothetical protein
VVRALIDPAQHIVGTAQRLVDALIDAVRLTVDSVPVLGDLPVLGRVLSPSLGDLPPPAVPAPLPAGTPLPPIVPGGVACCAAPATAVVRPPAATASIACMPQSGSLFATGAARIIGAGALAGNSHGGPGKPGPAAPGQATPQGALSGRSGGSERQPPVSLAVQGFLPPLMAHRIPWPADHSGPGRSPDVSALPG